MRLAVLASGTGSIYTAITDAGVDVALVLVDRDCRAIELAQENDVQAVLVERADFGTKFDRDQYSRDVVTALRQEDIDVAAMAGFGTILSNPFFDAYEGRVLNTHPSLLPSFPGWHGTTPYNTAPELQAAPFTAPRSRRRTHPRPAVEIGRR